jgi:hypothetical protein
VIETFGDSETEKIYSGTRSRKLPGDIQIRARRKLRMHNQSRNLQNHAISPRIRGTSPSIFFMIPSNKKPPQAGVPLASGRWLVE